MHVPRLILLLSSLFAATAGAEPRLRRQRRCSARWGVETRHISPSIGPGDDFYRYVNEGWLKTATPPPGLPYANAFVDAYLRTQAQLQALIDDILAARPRPAATRRRSRRFTGATSTSRNAMRSAWRRCNLTWMRSRPSPAMAMPRESWRARS